MLMKTLKSPNNYDSAYKSVKIYIQSHMIVAPFVGCYHRQQKSRLPDHDIDGVTFGNPAFFEGVGKDPRLSAPVSRQG
jgi:hypothetical protein